MGRGAAALESIVGEKATGVDGLPPRQRRLREEGSSFQQTLDALRHSLANHYLHHSSLSGTEISFLLGFEDHAHAAFAEA